MNSSSVPSGRAEPSANLPKAALLPTQSDDAAPPVPAAAAPRALRAPTRRPAPQPRPESSPPPSPSAIRQREAIGILLLACGLFVLLSSGSLLFGSGELMGPVGQWLALSLYRGVGISVLGLGVGVIYLAVQRLRSRPVRVLPLPLIGGLGLFVSLSVLLHVGGDGLRVQGITPGGAVGEYAAELGVALLGVVGTVLVAACLLLLSLLATTPLTLGGASVHIAAWGRALGARLHQALSPLRTRWQQLLSGWRTRSPAPSAEPAGAAQPSPSPAPAEGVPQPLRDYGDDRDARHSGSPLSARRGAAERGEAEKNTTTASLARSSARETTRAQPEVADAGPVIVERKAAGAPSPAQGAPGSLAAAGTSPAVPHAATDNAATEPMTSPPQFSPEHELVAAASDPREAPAALPPKATARSPFGPAEDAFSQPHRLDAPEPASEGAEPPIVLPSHEAPDSEALSVVSSAISAPAAAGRPGKRRHSNYQPLHAGPFAPPPIDLLDYEEPAQREIDRRAMLELAHRLEGTLGDYQVKGRVTAIHPGPVVTMYEFVPAPGTKLSKITALSSDLAMALEALRVRIVAPIPGKAAVGIEVPNRSRETVYLKEIVADGSFIQARSKLTMALGKDISGAPVCVDLARMPHLLIAGTTGSGKSVAVNGMVCSLLCNASPDEVKMIMIDPKMLELSIYEGIPHLLLPVVTEPKKANLALKWAVDEMERRYELISKEGVRDINGYNKKIEKQLEVVEQGQRELFGDSEYHMADRPAKLPFIVVLIDEFADLMMVASKEVETSVARIAQKARAAGIHLILATQRPSVDVITGLIKANFPSRIAFQVASRVDSRTILDAQGAENLLGMGDMLFTDRGQALRRVHGALITDTEVHRIVEHLKLQGQPIYDMDILRPRADEEGEEQEEDMSDELYDQAVRLVSETRQASISMVQRRLRIGYNRAARMIERMEREGIVSAPDGKNGREVLVSSL
jgi:S-DNA-T family DNA segregation ATPase FtsK/SpoIIIE